MVSDVQSLLISCAYVAASLLLCLLLQRVFYVPSVIVRKILHILSSLWVFMMVYGFSHTAARAAGPVLFIVLNGVYSAGKGRRLDNGLVSFPVSLLLITLLYSFGRLSAESAVSSMLVLGFGDGAAAVTGYMLHKTGKSIEGSVSMFLVSFIVLLLFSPLSVPERVIAALAAAAAERMTPSGLDNLTVPLTTALVMEVLCIL